MSFRREQPFYKTVPVGNPAAGADWSIAAPGQGHWRVVSVQFTLTTAVAVANRIPSLTLTDGTNQYFVTPVNAVQAASLTVTYCAFNGAMMAGVAGGPQSLALPYGGLWVQRGHTLASSTGAIQAADQYSAIAMLVEEYPTGPHADWRTTTPTFVNERE